MNLDETKQLLSIIREVYPSRNEFNPESFDVVAKMWQRVFHNVTFKDLGTAFEIWFAKEKFAPTPTELNRIVKSLQNPEAFISAETAWETVHKAVIRYGNPQEAKAFDTFTSRIKRAVKAVGGWQVICATPDGSQWNFLRKNFMEAYDEFSSVENDQLLLPPNTLKKIQERLEQNSPEKLDQPKDDDEQVS
jgi:hypothetical protein